MAQALTASLADVGEALFNYYEENKSQLGLEDVWYGDQSLYPRVPCLAIEPLTVDRVLAGTGIGGQTDNRFTVYIYIYHGTLIEVQESRKTCDRLASDVEEATHKNLQLNGIIVHGYITKYESGQADRGSLLGVTRLTWEGISKTLLGAS